MLEVKKIDVFYGNSQVLWDVSLEVREGEIVSIIGANGAGKSTTLKTIIGLLVPRSGSIKFLGEDITKLPPHERIKRGISLIPEREKIFPKMSVEENLLLGLYPLEEKKKGSEKLEWIFEIFPILKERKNQQAGTLSGGEQQMLAIARALMSSPKLLILDEPSQGLAPIMVSKVFNIVENLKKEGVTILLSAQNVFHSLSISDRAYVLENGRITMEGKGKELLKDEKIKKSYLGM
ncbi:MAG: ABC transporter ATP-binding protein [Candidatus Hydrothermarchaeota archaeon]|nr:MAG: ABC transporter ATP-binding protein [Candidatus Hydrothermarchaeota archaeon]